MKAVPVKGIKIHIIAWSIFIAYEILIMLPTTNWRYSNFWDDAVHYALYISLFYFNAHVALSWSMRGNQKRYFLYVLIVIAEFIVYTGIKYIILYLFAFFSIPLFPAFTTNAVYITVGFYRFVYFLGFSTAYWFAITTLQDRKKIAELENTRLTNTINKNRLESAIVSSENAYLKSQINPHFLFNSLNFIYSSVSKFSETIADTVMSLSEIMRYALSDTAKDGTVLLASEVEHIQNFIKLNQARFNQRLCIDFEIAGEIDGQKIIPLIFITLVENIFKYGNLSDPSSPARIVLTLSETGLTFMTENLKRKRNNVISYGLGIENLKRRLSLNHRFDLDIDENEQFYRSALRIWF